MRVEHLNQSRSSAKVDSPKISVGVMSGLHVYLSILLGIKILLLILFAALVFKGQLWLKKRRQQTRAAFPHEVFYCVKSSLKQMNDRFYVAQVVFTNKKNCTLTAQRESPRHAASEEQD